MPSHLNDDGTVALDDDPQARALAIVHCGLCDDDGYRGGSVCDHVDHVSTTERGRALVKAELAKIAARKAGK